MRKSMPILLIEDDHIDVMIVARALKDLGVTNKQELTLIYGNRSYDQTGNYEIRNISNELTNFDW
jgi:hypothetical protein